MFQEQVDQLLQTFAGYTSGEAEDTREAIHKKRREEFARSIREVVLARIRDNGFTQAVAEKVYVPKAVAGIEPLPRPAPKAVEPAPAAAPVPASAPASPRKLDVA